MVLVVVAGVLRVKLSEDHLTSLKDRWMDICSESSGYSLCETRGIRGVECTIFRIVV